MISGFCSGKIGESEGVFNDPIFKVRSTFESQIRESNAGQTELQFLVMSPVDSVLWKYFHNKGEQLECCFIVKRLNYNCSVT